jgi:AcrR family transcriptional regulator
VARTQAADYDERRLAIVETAARLFARDGFLGASVADVAEACMLSKSALYHYYSSKEDILYDVMHSYIVALNGAAQAIMAGPGDAKAKLRALTREFMSRYVGAADRHKVLLNNLERLPKARRQAIVSMQRGLIDAMADLLCEIEPRLRRRAAERRPVAMLVFGMINWTHTWFDPNGAVSAEQLADMAVDLALGGLKEAV